MFEVGSIYSLDPYSTSLEEEYKCTGDVYSYSDGMRLYEMQSIDYGDYVIVDEYGELYGAGSFDDWGFWYGKDWYVVLADIDYPV